jgi:hypothetical protein
LLPLLFVASFASRIFSGEMMKSRMSVGKILPLFLFIIAIVSVAAVRKDRRNHRCNNIKFHVTAGIPLDYTGTVDGDTMSGTMSGRAKTGNWKATRAK